MNKISKLDYLCIDTKQEPCYDSEPSEFFPQKNDYEYFNLMTPYLVSLVISFVGYQFKLLMMSWYKCVTQF